MHGLFASSTALKKVYSFFSFLCFGVAGFKRTIILEINFRIFESNRKMKIYSTINHIVIQILKCLEVNRKNEGFINGYEFEEKIIEHRFLPLSQMTGHRYKGVADGGQR